MTQSRRDRIRAMQEWINAALVQYQADTGHGRMRAIEATGRGYNTVNRLLTAAWGKSEPTRETIDLIAEAWNADIRKPYEIMDWPLVERLPASPTVVDEEEHLTVSEPEERRILRLLNAPPEMVSARRKSKLRLRLHFLYLEDQEEARISGEDPLDSEPSKRDSAE